MNLVEYAKSELARIGRDEDGMQDMINKDILSDDLEAENEELRADLEQAKAERDAAISDLETIMAYGGGNLDTCQYCKNGQCYVRGGTKSCLPKWRGQKEE